MFWQRNHRSLVNAASVENAVVTPHAAFISEESTYDLEVTAAAEVARVLTGQMPESVVNPEVLSKPDTSCYCTCSIAMIILGNFGLV